jgi:peptidoglycan/LPS O-acetylase OafA/YrhL
MKYIKGLDTLRALAVTVVIIAHWWLPLDINEANKNIVFWIHGLIPDGGFGVDLFFVLSGFLITSILLDAVKNNDKPTLNIIVNFMVRRALRIFPIYYLSLIVLIYMGYPYIKDNLLWFALYISNIQIFELRSFNAFSHTWSLAVEEQFYLVWPWFIVFIRKQYVKFVFFAAILIGILTSVYVMKIQQNWAGYVLTPVCMQAFGIGGLYAYLTKTGDRAIFFKFIKLAFPLSVFLHFYWAFSPDSSVGYEFLFITINSIISIWLIDKVINNKLVWVKKYVLENRAFNKIGQISYGIYLYHFALEFVYKKLIQLLFSTHIETETFLLDWKNSYFIRLALLFIISLGSFYLIEKPILKLKKYFNY